MFEVNDTVLYGTDGVCVITEISRQKFGRTVRDYYVLRPVYQDGAVIYVPTDSEKLLGKMRRILSAEEICQLIRAMPQEERLWVDDEGERKRLYTEVLHSGDRRALVRMVKALYEHRQALQQIGRKFHTCDERFLRDAEQILYHEFAHVLHIEPDQVQPFILRQIELAQREKEGAT